MVVELHIVVDPYITIKDAHNIANSVELDIRGKFQSIENVLIHMDPYNDENEDVL